MLKYSIQLNCPLNFSSGFFDNLLSLLHNLKYFLLIYNCQNTVNLSFRILWDTFVP